VTSIGYIADPEKARKGMIRRWVGADQRLPWEQLFFLKRFGAPLTREEAADHAASLEMVRLGPSASNKQPWRIVKDGSAWHFYLQRTKGYREGTIQKHWKVADIQRLDMGIAMCHFELTAGELGSSGKWVVQEPGIGMPDDLTEYTVSWVS
jgi:hypothetical protein